MVIAMFEQPWERESGFSEESEHFGFRGKVKSFMAEKGRLRCRGGLQYQAGCGGEMDKGNWMQKTRDSLELV